VTNAYPLGNTGWIDSVNLHPDQESQTSAAALYFADEHALATLGVRLVAGRNFTAAEIAPRGALDAQSPSVIIVSRALADNLFPRGNALGQPVYVESKTRPATIIGVVERLQMPYTAATGGSVQFIDNSLLEPFRLVAQEGSYVVRVAPQRLDAVMQQAQRRLLQINRARVLQKVRSLTEWREVAHRDDRGLAIILGVVCAALIIVTAFGIVGLTSYWVTQRQRQIGIRRALGATRMAIVRYFQTENLMIATAGALLGIGLALGLNVWMVSTFAMARLNAGWVLAGAGLVLGLGQLAVLWPALRAASIPPALATRSA
jgi:putative ABC transport system permease protein